MTLSQKLILLRKQKAWSQEEFAEKLDVTRQSVSKWESGQSLPDIANILLISEIFGVSTDYLLKDEYSDDPEGNRLEAAEIVSEDENTVSMEEAERCFELHLQNARKMATAVLLCIISPICLLLLIGAHESGFLVGLSIDVCTIIGIIVLLITVGIAVSLFMICGNKTNIFDFIETEHVKLDDKTRDMLKDQMESLRPRYNKSNTIGVILCILSIIPTLLFSVIEAPPITLMIGISLMLIIASLGVFCFVNVGVPWGSLEKLLEKGEYTRKAKDVSKYEGPVMTAYWLCVTALFLGYSFCTDDWGRSWIIWPVAGVGCGILCAILQSISGKNK